MKRLTILAMTLLLLTVMGCRRNKTIQYVRVVEDSAAAAANDIPKTIDPFENDGTEDNGLEDDDGIIAIPDIPQERSVNMGASDYELKKVMSGKSD